MTRPNKKNAKRAKTRAFRARRRELAERDGNITPATLAKRRDRLEHTIDPTDEVAALRDRMAQQEAELAAAWQPGDTPLVEFDDKGYEPPAIDPLRKGVARVNDITAKAAARRKAMTKFEYDQEQKRTGS